jgi:hypothetical protein
MRICLAWQENKISDFVRQRSLKIGNWLKNKRKTQLSETLRVISVDRGEAIMSSDCNDFWNRADSNPVTSGPSSN